MKSILITAAVGLVLSCITGGFSYWKGLENGKAIQLSDQRAGQIAAAESDIEIIRKQEEVSDYRPDNPAFLDELRDPKTDF